MEVKNMHWEVHITEFQNVNGRIEQNSKICSRKKLRLIDYRRASKMFDLLCLEFKGVRNFENGLTKVGISEKYGEDNRWYMISLTLEKGWV